MPTPRKKLPQHVTWALEQAETHQARITRLLNDTNDVMTDRRGINRHALAALLAKIGESNALIGSALNSIERRDPPPSNDDDKAFLDGEWLQALEALARTERAKLTRAFIAVKIKEVARKGANEPSAKDSLIHPAPRLPGENGQSA